LNEIDAVTALGKIPPGLWNLVASLLALAGVIATIVIQGKRIREQLSHDKKQKDRDREMHLRKEIFLGAAEAIAAGVQSLARYSDPQLSTDDVLQDYASKSPFIAKLYLIANPKTIRAVAQVVGAIGAAQLRSNTLRIRLLEIQELVQTARLAVQTCDKDRTDMSDALKSHHVVGDRDDAKFQRLCSGFEFFGKQTEKYAQQEQDRRGELLRHQLEMARAWQHENAALLPSIVTALVAIREELELPIDAADLRAVLQESLASSSSSFNAYLDNFSPASDEEKIRA
jgi:hypothetical protein